MSTPMLPALARLHDALADRFGTNRVRSHVALAPLTTFKIGGPADLFFEARTADELADAITLARASVVPYFLLGLGANILVGDHGFRGLVIRNAAARVTLDEPRHRLRAESGAVVFPDLIETAVRAGLSGLEHYVGIPSTVGGALWQNLHFLSPDRSRTMFIEEVLLEADLLTEEGARKTVGVDYFEYGYDDSILHHRDDLVLSATFQLAPHDEATMRAVMAANLDWRKKRHPPLDTEPSAGSIFQKIEGVGAGRLIDWCGLKGCRIGGAMVTHRHANIFINQGLTEGGAIGHDVVAGRGGATARDVRHLITHVQTVVEREQGYRLQPEIKFVGDFGDLPGMLPTNWADADGFTGGLPPGGHTDAHAESVGR
ncbi:MAG: UDP-N-acetylmuramate dehydrogenase [Bacteroidota bacterium]